MAAPSFVNAGTGATDAGGAWTYTCQASAAAGRVFIVQVLQDGTTNGAVTFTGASNINVLAGSPGWTQIPGPNADGSWPVGDAVAARQFLYIGRASGTFAPLISGGNSTSEDLYIRSYQFTNVSTGTTLATVIENGTAGTALNTAGTTNTVGGDNDITTLGSDRLAVALVAINDDNPFAGFSGTNWTTRASYAEPSGTDGALYLADAPMTAAGTTDFGSSNITDSDAWGVVGFALIGTTVDGPAATLNPRFLRKRNYRIAVQNAY